MIAFVAQAKSPQHAVDAATGTLQQQVLNSRTGMPVVRRRVDFTELLRDIRLGHVDRVEYIDNAQYSDNWYRDPTTWNVIDGSCLVVYKDGRVAYVRPLIPSTSVAACAESTSLTVNSHDWRFPGCH